MKAANVNYLMPKTRTPKKEAICICLFLTGLSKLNGVSSEKRLFADLIHD